MQRNDALLAPILTKYVLFCVLHFLLVNPRFFGSSETDNTLSQWLFHSACKSFSGQKPSWQPPTAIEEDEEVLVLVFVVTHLINKIQKPEFVVFVFHLSQLKINDHSWIIHFIALPTDLTSLEMPGAAEKPDWASLRTGRYWALHGQSPCDRAPQCDQQVTWGGKIHRCNLIICIKMAGFNCGNT